MGEECPHSTTLDLAAAVIPIASSILSSPSSQREAMKIVLDLGRTVWEIDDENRMIAKWEESS